MNETPHTTISIPNELIFAFVPHVQDDNPVTIDGISCENLVGDDELGIRMTCPIYHPMAESLREIAYQVCTVTLSQSDNNDPCDVTIRERTAHFGSHDDLRDYHAMVFHVVVDVHINDFLT